MKFARYLLLLLCVSISASAETIYFTDGDAETGYIVNTATQSFQTFSLQNGNLTITVPSGEYAGYPIAVINNQLVISSRNGLVGNIYDNAGVFINSFSNPGNNNYDQLLDGTTDGRYNYAVRCCIDQDIVIRAGLNWESSQILFSLPAGGAGIAYDTRSKTLWLALFDGDIVNYSLAGQELSRFTIGTSGRGLAYDARSNSLWFINGQTLYNYATTGVLLGTYVISGFPGNNIFGGEFMFLPLGPSSTDTLESMRKNAAALRNSFNLLSSKIAQGLSYDCSVFDANNICVAFAGTKSSGGGDFDTTTGALIVAHKTTPNFRVGGYVDQGFGSSESGGLKLKRGSPGYGVFGVWSENADGSGVQVRVSANQSKVDTETTRTLVGDAEAGFGKSNIRSNGLQLEVSRGYTLNSMWTARPYVGVRQTINRRGGYPEIASDDVTAPLTYSSLRQTSQSFMAGARFAGLVAPQTYLHLSAGLEYDFKNKIDQYKAVNDDIGAIDPINMEESRKRVRPVASVGLSQDIDKTERISLSVTHRKEAFESGATTYGMLQYSKGF